jgi:hypothetical protein
MEKMGRFEIDNSNSIARFGISDPLVDAQAQ